MVYRCTNDFELPLVDAGGYPTGESRYVVCDTLWEIEEDSVCTLTGAEIRLISTDEEEGFDWIDISKDMLKSNFEIKQG